MPYKEPITSHPDHAIAGTSLAFRFHSLVARSLRSGFHVYCAPHLSFSERHLSQPYTGANGTQVTQTLPPHSSQD